jgi:hypothetical protein
VLHLSTFIISYLYFYYYSIPIVYSTTLTPLLPLAVYFENAIGRLSVQAVDQHIVIAYHPGHRQAAALHTFLIQAGQLLLDWGWNKLLATQVVMRDFSGEETAEVCAYWRTMVPRHPALLHGALLLPHHVVSCLSHLAT